METQLAMLTWIKYLEKVTSIGNSVSTLFPVKYILGKKYNPYVYEYHIKQIIHESNNLFEISTYFNLADIYECPPFRGVMSELFRPNEFYPSPKDIAISVNISINGYCNEKETYNDAIIDFSYSFIKKLKKRAIEDSRLNELFSKLGKDINMICLDFDRNNIEATLNNKKEMFSYYFKSFEDKNLSQQITIWHQANEKKWIEWKSEDSITLNIDPGNIREGFFLSGFDYSKNGGSLTYATRINGYEYFNGASDSMEDINQAIWLR